MTSEIFSEISAAVILDAILVIFLILSLVLGARRGLIKSVWKIASLALTIVLVMTLKTPFTSRLAQTSAADSIYASVTEKITLSFSDPLYYGEVTAEQKSEIAKNLALPKVVVWQLLKDYDAQAVETGTTAAISRAVDNIARSITMMILGFVAAAVLFILIKLALFILYQILKALSKLPVIHGTNKLLGAVTGLLNALFIVFIICAIISFAASDNSSVYRMISETYIVKYFYNYNILLQLFIKA